MKRLIILCLIILPCLLGNAQNNNPVLAYNSVSPATKTDTTPRQFSNSESPEYTFIVSSDLKEKKLVIETNYTNTYKVRFIDYWAKTKTVYKDNQATRKIDLDEFDRSIFIMNISDQRSNKLLSSQVINLKRRNF